MQHIKEEYELLLRRARATRAFAYAPYSRFAVGAALSTRSGAIFVGANVENASYGLTICAERAAVGAAIAAGETEFVAVAITADSSAPPLPCGACRQVLAEFNPDLAIICSTTGGAVEQYKLQDLLPRAHQGLSHKR